MTNITSRFVSLAVLAVDAPASAAGTWRAMTHLAAVAILIAELDAGGGYRFALKHCAIGAGDPEDVLLAWAAGVIPESGIMIGWQLADAVIAPLLEAGRGGDPELASAFLARLLKLVTAPSVDLALIHGGTAAPPLAKVAAQRGIDLTTADATQTESAWAFGDTGWLLDYADEQAVAVWRLWLAEANGVAADVSKQFEAWWTHRLR